MTETRCVVCDRPVGDGYACHGCGITRPGGQLREIAELTGPARDVAHGQTRRGSGGGSGKPESRLPLDLGATSKLDAVQGSLGTWCRHIAEIRGGRPQAVGTDLIVHAAHYLEASLEWMRHRAEVDEFLADVERSARVIRGLARGPAEQKYLGPCGAELFAYGAEPEDETVGTCDGDVYAPRGGSVGRCRVCGAEVASADREAWLDGEVRSHAFRAAEIEDAFGIKANLIRQWATPARGLVQVHAQDREGRALYLLSHVLDVAAAQAAKRAEAEAKRARRAATRAEEDAA